MDFNHVIAEYAVESLIEEAELTPKPGLVDQNDNGAHDDLNLDLLFRSAQSLRPTFHQISTYAVDKKINQQYREDIAELGRIGEKHMYNASGGTNTHKGAIWALGLLVASASTLSESASYQTVASTAGYIARFPDRKFSDHQTNGSCVQKSYGVTGARGEAQRDFPHVINLALPTLWKKRKEGALESHARLDALMAIISSLDDTCILHRGGMKALQESQYGAKKILDYGGVATDRGWEALLELNLTLLNHNASPGGSADLLAAALFLDKLETAYRKDTNVMLVNSLSKL